MESNERTSALPEANEVIGYAEGLALLKIEGDPDNLYYCSVGEGHVSLGENLPYAESKPVLLLPEEQQQRLYDAVGWKKEASG